MKLLSKAVILFGILVQATVAGYGAALQFDGANDYVQAGSIVLSNTSFTIEAWARKEVNGKYNIIASQGTIATARSMLFGFRNTDTFTFLFYNNDLNTTNTYTDLGWHHWAGTYDTTTRARRIYQDGVLVAGDVATADYQGSGPLILGDAVWHGNVFSGLIDEVRVWNVARTGAEIAASWNRRLAGNEPGLLAYYPMNEAAGATTADATGHGYDGTLINGVLRNTSEDAVGPLALTDLAAWTSETSVQLNGWVKPGISNLFVWFEWGSTTNYGSTTTVTNVASGFDKLPVTALMTSLDGSATYHFRAVGSNSFGVSYGADRSFTLTTVTSLADSGPGSLRQAIADAVPGTIICLTNRGTIALTSGDLWVNKDLVIAGPGAADLAISGSYASRVFHIEVNATAVISGLTIRDGRTPNGANGGSAGAAGSLGVAGGGIYTAGRLTLNDCVITNNRTGNGGAGMYGVSRSSDEHNTGGTGGAGGAGGFGGGIYNHNSGVLTLNRCTVSGNSSGAGGAGGVGGNGSPNSGCYYGHDGGSGGLGGAGGYGAAIYSAGVATLNQSSFVGNSTGSGGSGGKGGNGGNGYGGGNGGPGAKGGRGGNGGGIYCAGQATLVNCTVSGNSEGTGGTGGQGGSGGGWEFCVWPAHGSNGSAGPPNAGGDGGEGGGLYNVGSLTLISCTIANNVTGSGGAGGDWPWAGALGVVGYGGGINNGGSAPQVQIVNTIVGLNSRPVNTPDDVRGAVSSRGHNLIGNTNGSAGFGANGDVLNVPPLIAPLADNGGPTRTHALWPESPAVNGGDNIAAAGLVADQRGLPRIVCSNADIGAVEYESCVWLPHPTAQTALYFDGANDSVQTGPVSLSNSPFTVEAWAKRGGLGTGDNIVGHGKANVANQDLHFGFRPNNVFTFAFRANDLDTTNAYTDTDWHHWAGTYETNGRVRSIYRDGVLVARDIATANYQGAGPLIIGNRVALDWPFDGVLDEVRVWNVARTSDELRQNINRPLSGTEAGLVAYYRFDEGSGATARNGAVAMGNSMNGGINGPTYVGSSTPLYQPTVTTLAAELVRSSTATLRGLVNPAGPHATTAWFEYGPSLYFGRNSAFLYFDPGLTPQPVAVTVSNLESGTKYFVRLVANNAVGTTYGETLTFDTLVVGSGYPISARANNGQSTIAPRHVTDAEGNIYLAGLFSGSAQFKDTLLAAGSPTNAFLAKLARGGDWRWAVNVPVRTNGFAQIKALALENERNLLVAGSFRGGATFGTNDLTATTGTRAFVARFDPVATNWTWAIALGAGTNNSANALAVGGDGAIYVAGEFSGATAFGTNETLGPVTLTARGSSDAFVARFNATGGLDWVTQAGGTGTTNRDAATALALGPFGEIYAAGSFMDQGTFGLNSVTSAGASDLFFAGLNLTNGNIQRVSRAGGSGADCGTALATDSSGRIFLVGQLYGAANIGGSPLPELDPSGTNLVVLQLDRQGMPSRRAAARSANADSIVVAPSGRIYLAGDYTGLMRYGPTLVTVGNGTNGSSDVFLAQLAEGTDDRLNWTDFKQIGGIGTETRGTVTVDASGSVVVSGTYSQTLHLNYVELSTANAQEIFLARVDAEGVYEHNRWEIGQAIVPPDAALDPPYEQGRAKGFPSIEILEYPDTLPDTSDLNAFSWNETEKKLYAIRPVTARLKWPLTHDTTNLTSVALMVGRCYWPDHPQTNVAGAPVEVAGPNVGLGFYYAEIAFNTNNAVVLPVTRGADQFQVFQTATNVSGYNVIRYTQPDGKSAFDVVFTRPYGNWAANETALVGDELKRWGHQDATGKNGFVFYERAFYDAAAHDRATRAGPILPVNRNIHNDPSRDLVVVWYRTNDLTGVAWGCDPVRYTVNWPPPNFFTNSASPALNHTLVIASGAGSPIDSDFYPLAHVYQQPDPALAGFNPNEEHAFLTGGKLYALRSDLNDQIVPKASEPYALLKYRRSGATTNWAMQVFRVVAETQDSSFDAFCATNEAGKEIQLPESLNLLPLCASSNRITWGTNYAHKAWTGRIYAKSQGYLQVQYWYPIQPDFYVGTNNWPVGAWVPWMSQYDQGATLGATHRIGEPVLVGYHIAWPADVKTLAFGDTLTTTKNGLPDVMNWQSARIIFDENDPACANYTNATVRLYDPISDRVVQLASAFKLPETIAKANDRGKWVFSELPFSIRSRLRYDSLNQQLSFGGVYDEPPTGEPLLLPNVLSLRECNRILQLSTDAKFREAVTNLYNLTRNPNQVDADRDGRPDLQLRIGLITEIREGNRQILAGPVILNLFTNYTTNVVAEWVGTRVTNIIQEPLGDLKKAVTAALRPTSGYVTLIENDDPALPGQPIGLRVIRILDTPFQGDLKVLTPDSVFDERLTVRHSGDFGGEPQNFEFEWFYQPDQTGQSPPLPDLTAGQTNWNGWIQFPTPPLGTTNGYNDVTLGEGNNLSSLLTLGDNWLICRYRGWTATGPTPWSDWVGAPGGDRAMLAEGWIKRVLGGLNAFDSRVKDFHTEAAATYASMVLQAGERYEGPVAFNPDPSYLNQLGLIESYETVLDRGRKLSVDGIPPVNFGPANDALLRAAGEIAGLYMLLGNEAYADASDPTIGFTTSSGEYGNLAPSIFCFQNQLDSPLEEELSLLRGRDDSGMSVRARSVYNRLLWNFTQGEGEVAYKLTYNISDQNGDGFIDEKDAKILYPQGHGDAWGHYLTATKKYYALLRHPYYEWVPRPEAVTVGGSPVQVDYLDERKFAAAAAAKARTGAEIVNLTYRQKYVEDPAGQWQGYKDTQSDRAWGVSEWAARAGTGAYFDWIVANAILPATDPDTNHVGIQKIDRTTVTELEEIPSQFAAIETQLDAVDRGLNPLGLAAGSMPFDIDPSKVAAGQTHFDQIYERALKAMDNTLALFDHVNTLSQNLRRNQDAVDDFAGNVQDQERDYKNRLIEIFGYPYAGDIGPTGAFPSGYDGPDILHYMYVNAGDLTGDATQPNKLITAYYKALDFGGTTGIYFPDDVQNPMENLPGADGTLHVSYPLVENGAYQFAAPGAWGRRRAPGKIQNALGEMLKAQAQLNQGLVAYNNLRMQIQDEVDLLQAQTDLAAVRLTIRTRETTTLTVLSAIEAKTKAAENAAKDAADQVKDGAQAGVEALPKAVGLATDPSGGFRAFILKAAGFIWGGLKKAGSVLSAAHEEAEDASLILQSQTSLAIDAASVSYEVQQRVKVIEQLYREEAIKRVDLFTLQGDLEQTYGAYLSALAEGQRLMDERYQFRVKTAARVQESRYQDMAFRIFQNDALQKYRAQFDLAARYVYLAAKAYDYETCLLNTETGAGSKLLTDIVRQRTLGQLVNGRPVSGRQGLADPLARMGQNFEVYRGQLGFTTPETETGRFSLRSELFRVRPGDLQTNALNGLVSTNQDWNALLEKCRVPDLWKVPEFRRYCRPFAPESAGPQPGLVIRIPTTVTFGLNYFGWPLGPGDSAYDPSRFATKVRSAGVWFQNYNLAGLSMTPRVYLVPAGVDILRSPSSDKLETREFNVVDQKLPVPFPIGTSDLANPGWIPANDSLSETFGDIRRFSSFRAYHDQGWFDENEATQDTRLIGRSVWNSEWLLIIPGGTFLYDPDRGLDTFIATVGDIKIFFQTYAYSGN